MVTRQHLDAQDPCQSEPDTAHDEADETGDGAAASGAAALLPRGVGAVQRAAVTDHGGVYRAIQHARGVKRVEL